MRVAVLGAGVVGVTTAYQLLKDGHEVVVVERNQGAADETSFGNAGMIAPGHAFAWASPKVPRILLKSLLDDTQAFRFRFRADRAFWSWTLRFLGECTNARARENTRRKFTLCAYSQTVLHETVAETDIEYERGAGGLLYFYRSQESLDRGVANRGILVERGLEQEVVDRDRAAELEPALAPVKERIAGGVYCHTDESGDCHIFTQALARKCAEMGAEMRYGTTVDRLEVDGDRVVKAVTDRGDVTADAFVLALGCQSPFLLRPHGVKLQVQPIKGYALTVPIDGRNNPPRIGGVDEDNLTAYTPMGDRLRVTAKAEFAGYDTSHQPRDFAKMLSVLRELFPDAGNYDKANHWAGLRPMTPEGTPILGRAKQSNLYLNTGQGHMGWTMSHGSARITADLIAGRTPAIALDGMTLN